MSSEQVTTSEENTDSTKSPETGPTVGPERGQQILELQAKTLRRLNDEWLRIIRIHLVFAGGVVTGISFLGLNALTLPSAPTLLTAVFWSLVSVFTTVSAMAWLSRIISERPLYTDLKLSGEYNELDYKIEAEFAESTLSILKNLFFENPTISEFENYIQELESSKDEGTTDYQEAINHNVYVIKSREEYVDHVHRQLNILFLSTLMGLLFMVLIS